MLNGYPWIEAKLTQPRALCPEKTKLGVTETKNELLQLKECSGRSQNTPVRIEKFQRQQEERHRRWH